MTSPLWHYQFFQRVQKKIGPKEMILIDSRVGSRDLLEPLGKGAMLATLEYGDISFVGLGPKATPLFIGIEFKTVMDVLACVIDGRFAGHQLPGLVKEYDHVYLLIEGLFKANSDGILEIPRGRTWREVRLGSRRFMWRDFQTWLTSMETFGGVKIRHTSGRKETILMIKALKRWWSSKEWEEHRSHLAVNKSQSHALGTKYSLKRRIAAQLPGIGDEMSGRVSCHFSSIDEMVNAPKDIWTEIEGIGDKTAEKIIKEFEK
jgi:ERCC4-type nuclease